jgi:hypothetical protein
MFPFQSTSAVDAEKRPCVPPIGSHPFSSHGPKYHSEGLSAELDYAEPSPSESCQTPLILEHGSLDSGCQHPLCEVTSSLRFQVAFSTPARKVTCLDPWRRLIRSGAPVPSILQYHVCTIASTAMVGQVAMMQAAWPISEVHVRTCCLGMTSLRNSI